MEPSMSSNKHLKTATPTDADLKGNPEIGQTRGTTMAGVPADLIEGDSTVEGDVQNDTKPDGGVDPNHLGRTNR
jgi:hypothetical protein